mgnify:CR=1 FL=1
MLAGHLGAALAIGRLERRVNAGAFVAAAVLMDLLLWLFILLGWESVSIPARYAETRQPEFGFPYSHGLVAAVAWSALAGAAAFAMLSRLGPARGRAAALVAAAVFSHWLLDVLVHAPEMPLAGDASPKVGLGLWDALAAALALEALVAVAGLWAFLAGSALPRPRKAGLAALVLFVLAATVGGMAFAPPPPSANAMAGSSLALLVATCLLAAWLARRMPERP